MSFVDRAERALRGETVDGVEVLRGHAPPLLLPSDLGALLQAGSAALAWTALALVTKRTPGPSALVLFVTMVALALTVRGLRAVLGVTKRLSLAAGARRSALAIDDEGLLYRGAEGDVAMPKADVAAVVERGEWGRRAGRRTGDVYVVLRGGAQTFIALPPIFDETPGVLAERLMRWRGEVRPAPVVVDEAVAAMLPSKLYDAVARGERPPGVSVVTHGLGWLASGPWLTVLLGVAIVFEIVRVPSLLSVETLGVVAVSLAATLVLVPFAWAWLVRREISPRRGLALVLTPAEALRRTRGGVLRVPYDGLVRVSVERVRGSNLLALGEQSRRLLLQRRGAPEIRYDESFLGVPAEVAVALLESRRKDAAAAKAAPEATPVEAQETPLL